MTEFDPREDARRLVMLERLLAIEATDLPDALDLAAQLVGEAFGADKVDALLHEPATDVLVAVGVSDTPMGRRERALGLDRLPLTAGDRIVAVFQAGQPFHTGHADRDPHVLPAVTEELGIRSLLAVPLDVNGERRGVLTVASARPEHFAVETVPVLQAVARWVGLVAHRAELAERAAGQARARGAREVADRAGVRAARLQALTAALSGAVTEAQVAEAIMAHGLAALDAAVGLVAVLSDDGTRFHTLRTAGYPAEIADAWPDVPADAPLPIADAVRTQTPIVLESYAAYTARYPGLAASAASETTGALVSLPLLVRGQAIGGLGLTFPTARQFDAGEHALMRALADLCAQALDRARLYDAALRSRAAAEAATARVQAVLAITDAALAHLGLDDLLAQVLARITDVLGVDNTAILLLEEDEQSLLVSLAHGPEEAMAGTMRIPMGQGVAGRIAATRQPLIAEDVRALDPVNPYLREQVRSLLGIPLLAGDRLIGVMHVDSATPRRFTADDLRLLQLVGDRVALALDHARLYREERAARAEAERAVRLRDDILGLATHDLRAPLTGIAGRAQLIQRRLASGQELEPAWLDTHLRALRESVGRMQSTIDAISDVARLQQGQALELELGAVDVGELARTVAEEQSAGRESPAVQFTLPDEAVLVQGDAARLVRVLQNLVGNALKYSPDGAPVDVVVTAEGPDAVLTVRDRGVGIPADEIPQVFTRYYRASTAVGIRGTGIGLAGAKAIVEQHEGQITLESAVGHGTTVTVRLPRFDRERTAG